MDLERFQHAISLRDAGKLEESASELHSMYEELRGVSREEAGLMLLNEAVCLSKQGKPLEQCKTLLNQASELLGKDETKRALVDYTEASFHMGYRDRDPVKALEKLDSVLRKHAEILRDRRTRELLYGEIQLRRGLLLVEFKRFQEARKILKEVLELDVGKDAAFYFNLGRCHTELKEWDMATSQLLKALDMGLPEDSAVRTHFYLGTIYYQQGAHGKALQEFEFCEANLGRSTMPSRVLYKWLALTCQTIGRDENARRYSELVRNA
ncbi:MAG TPA: tetratricopeptide repeat protein [Candidatus Acidoferrales bacterium]|nr:tetratricopeptide repeat protein [Candidatus Acidoferrales bacterium]